MKKREDFDFKPRFFQILSEYDCQEYNSLRSRFASHAHQGLNRQQYTDFSASLDLIKDFCVRNDDDDWKRGLVCGIFWLNKEIAVNNSQFSILIDENKSSINNSFQKLGYSLFKDRIKSINLLTEKIPFFKDNYRELKDWTVRHFEAATPSPELPPINITTFFTFNTPNGPTSQFFSPPQSPIESPVIPQIERPASRPNPDDFFDDPFALPPNFLLDDDDNNGGNTE